MPLTVWSSFLKSRVHFVHTYPKINYYDWTMAVRLEYRKTPTCFFLSIQTSIPTFFAAEVIALKLFVYFVIFPCTANLEQSVANVPIRSTNGWDSKLTQSVSV